jgi:hypothetical protein
MSDESFWLPKETISFIISYVSINDYRNLSCVSHGWLAASQERTNWEKIEWNGGITTAIKFLEGLFNYHVNDVTEMRFTITRVYDGSADHSFSLATQRFQLFENPLVFPKVERFYFNIEGNVSDREGGKGFGDYKRCYRDLFSNLVFPNLTVLDLYLLKDVNFIPSFTSFPSLKHIIFRGDNLTDSICNEVSKLTQLQTLDVGHVFHPPNRNLIFQEWCDRNNVLFICNIGALHLSGSLFTIWQTVRDMNLPAELSPWAPIIQKYNDFGQWLFYGMIWSGQKPSFIKYLIQNVCIFSFSNQ